MYSITAQAFDRRPTLLAAARGHLALLRQRQSFTDEGGEELAAALDRFLNSAGTLRAGLQQADEISGEAQMALENLRSAPALAELEDERGPAALDRFRKIIFQTVFKEQK